MFTLGPKYGSEAPLTPGLESMLIPYEMFYRRHGVRRAVQMVSPPLSKLTQLELPRGSIYHYQAADDSEYGPEQDGLLLAEQPRLIMVDHVTQLGDKLGNPRPMPIPSNTMIREYHRKNRRTRPMLKPEVYMRDPRTLVVCNYSLIPHLYRYPTAAFASYHRWWNMNCAVWENMNRMHELGPTRQQYLICNLPRLLPSLALLRRGDGVMTRQLLERFNDPRALFILEMWKWLGENRSASMINRASAEALENVNLVWVEGDRWFMVNMGLLNQWRIPSKEEIDKGADAKSGLMGPMQMQKRFLRMLMMLMDTRAIEVSEPTVDPLTGEEVKLPEPVKPASVTVEVETADGGTRTVKVGRTLSEEELDNMGEETADSIQQLDEQLDKEMAALDKFYAEQVAIQAANDGKVLGDETVELAEDIFVAGETAESPVAEDKDRAPDEGFLAHADALAATGAISAAEYRRLMKLASTYQKLNNPFGDGTMAEHAVVKPEDLALSHKPIMPPNPAIPDQSMLSSDVERFDQQYVQNVLSKDVTAMLVNLQHGGVAITDYRVERHEDAMGKYEIHKVQVTPVRGKVSTLEFRLPVIEPDGTYRANGVRYRQRKQRADVPIRKVSPDKVALTSYYSKVFIARSEKQINNYPGWLTKQVVDRGMDPTNDTVDTMMLANVFDSRVKTPRVYSILAERVQSFNIGEHEFYLDYHSREQKFGAEAVKAAEKDGMVVIGRRARTLLVMDYNNAIYLANKELEYVGTIESLLNVSSRGPLERAEIKVFGKLIPVGVFLGYQMGLTRLVETLGLKPRRVPTGERLHMAETEYALRFSDESWVFEQDGKAGTLVMSGFLAFEKIIRNYPASLFDRRDIYQSVLEHGRIGLRHLREMDLMVDLFIDPITKGILEEMKEPTNFVGLVRRAVELLETDWAPDETDMAYMRVRGYERMAGAVYAEMIQSMRRMRASGNPSTAKMDMAPYAVYSAIQKDPAVKNVEDSNPIHNVKEKEEITYSGVGGRGSRSLVKHTRAFHENDLGVISEASKDSADVGVTTFLTADPNLTGLRGLTSRADLKNLPPATVLSSSALISPCAEFDDGKRVMFISIQHSSGTFADGYQPSPLSTGYERAIAHRCDDLFAATAKQDGKVVGINENAITVEYADGTQVSIQLGRRFGTVSSLVLPHQIDPALKLGDKFKAGDLIAYNSKYFVRDPLQPNVAVWKAGVLVTTAIAECADTLEDSSAISERVAKLMGTQMTHVRDITASFSQIINRMVKVGDVLEVDSILCTIEDGYDSETSLFDENSQETLRLLAANSPRAKHAGVVEKIEVFYNGDIDDMSPSLQALAIASDNRRRKLARDLNANYVSGKVDDSMRVDGNPLLLDNAVIRIHLTEQVAAGVGDKGVFGNQMKTIVGRIMTGRNQTESGVDIDAIFGYLSISNRIVRSPEKIGTTNTLLKVISKRVADVYFSK